jgi:hypothetical protein
VFVSTSDGNLAAVGVAPGLRHQRLDHESPSLSQLVSRALEAAHLFVLRRQGEQGPERDEDEIELAGPDWPRHVAHVKPNAVPTRLRSQGFYHLGVKLDAMHLSNRLRQRNGQPSCANPEFQYPSVLARKTREPENGGLCLRRMRGELHYPVVVARWNLGLHQATVDAGTR